MSMAVPGDDENKKRRIDEMSDDSGKAARSNKAGKGKGKGKGKKGGSYSWSTGPKDGCHTCGGPHYARECPKGQKGGKAKGKKILSAANTVVGVEPRVQTSAMARHAPRKSQRMGKGKIKGH